MLLLQAAAAAGTEKLANQLLCTAGELLLMVLELEVEKDN